MTSVGFKMLMNEWKEWARSADRANEGWQSDFPKWDLLITAAADLLSAASPDEETLSLLASPPPGCARHTMRETAPASPCDFLGYTFRWVDQRKTPGKKMVLCRPQKKKRTELLRRLGETMSNCLHVPIVEVVQRIVNPIVRGWVNYFRWGNAGRDLSFVAWQVDMKVRRFASRQRPKRRGGRAWTTWSNQEIYQTWKLFHDYKVAWCSEPKKQSHITLLTDSTGNAGWRKSPCPV